MKVIAKAIKVLSWKAWMMRLGGLIKRVRKRHHFRGEKLD